jgi:hypothetical protein
MSAALGKSSAAGSDKMAMAYIAFMPEKTWPAGAAQERVQAVTACAGLCNPSLSFRIWRTL